MNLLVATRGLAPHHREALEWAAEGLAGNELRSTDRNASVWLGSTGSPSAVLGRAEGGGAAAAVYGSGLRSRSGANDTVPRALKSSGATLGDGKSGALVAIYANPGEDRLVIAAGAGSHKLFIAQVGNGIRCFISPRGAQHCIRIATGVGATDVVYA